MSTPKIFFSYSRLDSEFALRLAQDIRSEGVDIWIDQLDIPAGARWDVEVENALANASCVLIILTPHSIASNNVQDEIAFALDSHQRIIPVLLEDCDLPFRIRRLKHINFKTNYAEGLEQLLSTVKQTVVTNSQVLQMTGAGGLLHSFVQSDINQQPESEIKLWQKEKTDVANHPFKHYLEKNPESGHHSLAKTAIANLNEQDRLYQPVTETNPRKSFIDPTPAKKIFTKTKIMFAISVLVFALMIVMVANIQSPKLKVSPSANTESLPLLQYSMEERLFPFSNAPYHVVVLPNEVSKASKLNQVENNNSKINPINIANPHQTNTSLTNTPKTPIQTKPVVQPKPTTKTKVNSSFQLGQAYQGGIIVYINDTGLHGFIKADKELGPQNFESATKRSLALKYGGYDDWRLPSKTELNWIYTSHPSHMINSQGMFWTATEVDQVTAWTQNLNDGGTGNVNKKMNCDVIAIRNF